MLEIFSAWDLSKGLSHQEKVQRVAALLNDKEASDITFTALESDGTLGQYVLGSVQGNTKFLMGLCSPAFHLAPYHFVVMNPDLSDEEAQAMYKLKGHPAIPQLWATAGQVPVAEGDLTDGRPHPAAFFAPKKDPRFLSSVDGRHYLANPETQTVEDLDTGNTFSWSLLANSYIASQDPNLVEKMSLFTPGVFDATINKSTVAPALVMEWSNLFKGTAWNSQVYPLVRHNFPKPGAVIKKGDLFAVVGNSDVLFFSQHGRECISAWGETYTSLDLTIDGTVGPGAVLNFAKSFLNYDVSVLESYS